MPAIEYTEQSNCDSINTLAIEYTRHNNYNNRNTRGLI